MSGSLDAVTNPVQPAAQMPVPQDESLLDPGGKNFFNNLLILGGNMAAAGNARTSGGFLANPGWSAFSVGLGQSVRDRAALTRQNIENQHGLLENAGIPGQQAETAARTTGLGLDNQVKKLNLSIMPSQIEWQKYLLEQRRKELDAESGGITPMSQTIAPAGTGPQSSLQPNIIAPHDKIGLIHSATVDRGLPEGVGLVLAGLPDSKGLVDTESGSDAHAVNKDTGAIGLGQILPSTARKPGYGMAGVDNPSELFDPQKNLNFSADYLYNRGKQQFGMTDADWAGKTPEAQQKIMALVGAYGGTSKNDPTGYIHQVLGRMYGNSHVAAGTDPTTAPDGTPITGMVSRAPIPATPEDPPTVEAGAPDQSAGTQVAGPGAGPSPSGSSRAGLGVTLAPDGSTPVTGTVSRTAAATPPAESTSTASAPEQVHLSLPEGFVPLTEAKAKFAAAQAKARRYSLLGGAAAGFDPKPYEAEAEKWQSYMTTMMQNAAAPRDLRGEGSAIVTPQGNIQTNVVKNVLGPDNREYMVTMKTLEASGQPAESAPGIPSWAPRGTQTIAPLKLSPSEESSQKDSANDAFGERAREAFAGANSTLMNMRNVQSQIDTVNSSGPEFWNSGQGADAKLAVAKSFNSALSLIGAAPLFDPNKIASYEDWVKNTKTAGMALARSMGSHEAASVVQMGLSSMPNIENTPKGAQVVKNVVTAGAQFIVDQHIFNANWATNPDWPFKHNPNDMRTADVAFIKMYPPEEYARRATSLTDPIKVKEESEVKKLLPGTQWVGPSGKVRTVPGEETVPFTPPKSTGIPQ